MHKSTITMKDKKKEENGPVSLEQNDEYALTRKRWNLSKEEKRIPNEND